jgi:hypothetical protein
VTDALNVPLASTEPTADEASATTDEATTVAPADGDAYRHETGPTSEPTSPLARGPVASPPHTRSTPSSRSSCGS